MIPSSPALTPSSFRFLGGCLVGAFLLLMSIPVTAAEGPLQLHLRSRAAPARGETTVLEKPTAWDPKKTVLIICDMWDDHWCKSAAQRVAEMAGPLNEMVKQARARGLFIIHSPSS